MGHTVAANGARAGRVTIVEVILIAVVTFLKTNDAELLPQAVATNVDGAVGSAIVVVVQIAIVARFAGRLIPPAVATNVDGAVGRTSLLRVTVQGAVVALLTRIDDGVAAHWQSAVSSATVAVQVVVIVTFFTPLPSAVTAERELAVVAIVICARSNSTTTIKWDQTGKVRRCGEKDGRVGLIAIGEGERKTKRQTTKET